MSHPPDAPHDRRLLPVNWRSAPWRYWQHDRYGAFTFLWTNVLLGTSGLWVPIVSAYLTRKPLPDLLQSMVASGSLYLFVIPFVASIATSVFMARHRAEGDSRPRHLDILKVAVFFVLGVCLFLMPYQVRSEESGIGRNGALQLIVISLSSLIGIYIYCLLKLDVEEPFTDEVNRKARQLQTEASKAMPKASDFDS